MARYRQGEVLEDAQGNRVQLVGREWVPVASRQETERQAALTQLAQNTGPVESFLVGAGRALGGGYLFPGGDEAFATLQRENPWSTGAGQLAPALAGGIGAGALTAGLGTAGRIGTTAAIEGGIGALGDPVDPLGSAVMGAGFGGLGAGLPAMLRAGRQAAAGASESIGGALQALPLPERVQRRILGIAGDMPPGGAGGLDDLGPVARGAVRTQENARPGGAGWFTPDEATAMGMRLTPGDELLLRSGNLDEQAFAQRVRGQEELRRSMPNIGRGIEDVRESQRGWITNYVTNNLELSPGTPLTPQVMGEKFRQLGREFDAVAQQLGNVPISKRALGGLEELVEQADRSYKTRLGSIHVGIEDALNRNNGVLTFEDWQTAKNLIDRTIVSAERQGAGSKLADFQEYAMQLQDAMLDSADEATRQALFAAREQYHLMKLLTKTTDTVAADGTVNVSQLRRNLGNNPARYKSAIEGELTRALDTVDLLQRKLTPNSGTADRMLAALAQTADKAPAAGLTAAAAAAGGALYSWLRGP